MQEVGRRQFLSAAFDEYGDGVALWPSLLLHTTQLAKDSLFFTLAPAFVVLPRSGDVSILRAESRRT